MQGETRMEHAGDVGWPGLPGGVKYHQQHSVFGGFERGRGRQLQYSGIALSFSRLMSLQMTSICWTVSGAVV